MSRGACSPQSSDSSVSDKLIARANCHIFLNKSLCLTRLDTITLSIYYDTVLRPHAVSIGLGHTNRESLEELSYEYCSLRPIPRFANASGRGESFVYRQHAARVRRRRDRAWGMESERRHL